MADGSTTRIITPRASATASTAPFKCRITLTAADASVSAFAVASHSKTMDYERLNDVLLYAERLNMVLPPYDSVQTIVPVETVIASPLNTFLLRENEPYQSRLPLDCAS